MSDDSEDGFTIQFENGSKIEVSTEDSSWRDDPSRLKGMHTEFLYVPPSEDQYTKWFEGELEASVIWALRQGRMNAAQLATRLLPIPRKYEVEQFSTPKGSNFFYETFREGDDDE